NGLLKTTHGVLTWTHLGEATFSGQGITALAPTSIATPTGELVLAGTFLAPGADCAACGVYQSRDGGTTWTKMPATSGLPDGPVTNLIEDPLNSQRFYVSIAKQCVYRGVSASEQGALTCPSAITRFHNLRPTIVG